MTRDRYLRLMNFPEKWTELGMFPEELAQIALKHYRRGDENGSEHNRNGAFHWWLKRAPTKAQLGHLLRLAAIDPDPLMADDVRQYIHESANFDDELETLSGQLFVGRPLTHYER